MVRPFCVGVGYLPVVNWGGVEREGGGGGREGGGGESGGLNSLLTAAGKYQFHSMASPVAVFRTCQPENQP